MTLQPAALPLRAERSPPLRGRVRAPGDKSTSHRAIIFGLLAVGRTEITGLLEGEDVLRTADAARALGALVERHGPGCWSVRGVGVGALLQPRAPLDFGNAGTGVRLMMGVTGSHPVDVRFDGDASLRRRPMNRILDPLALIGAEVLEAAPGGRLPPAASRRSRRGARDLHHARALGAGEIRRAPRRAERAGRFDRHRDGGDARPHGKAARLVRRGHPRRAARPSRPAHHARRPAGSRASARS